MVRSLLKIKWCVQGAVLFQRCCLSSIIIPIILSIPFDDHLIFIMYTPIPKRRYIYTYIYIETGPCVFSRVSTLAPGARFGQGSGLIWLDDLRCPMNANTLADCTHRGWGSHNCGHSEDMGLICATDSHATTYPDTPIPTEQESTNQPEVTDSPTTASSQHDAGL